MPVTLRPAPNVEVHSYGGRHRYGYDAAKATPKDILNGAVTQSISRQVDEIFQSSFTGALSDAAANNEHIYPNASSYVNSVISAYNGHQHLIIRPDDVWHTILTQFSLFVNANAEELRHLFVEHEGKKELEVKAGGNRYTVDFGMMAQVCTNLLHANVIDPKLRDWTIPNFTTTTENDRVVASILMMATLKSYFSYKFCCCCGLPSVTLLGEKSDWESILARIDKLKEFGKETTQWSKLLRPVISRFVQCFDKPEDPELLDFWQRVVHYSGGGSGPTYLSGWITAFCFFDEHGKPLYTSSSTADDNDSGSSGLFRRRRRTSDESQTTRFDGEIFHQIDTNDIPPAYAEVDVKLDDNGELFDTKMITGMVAVKCSSSAKREDYAFQQSEEQDDVVQPMAGWFIYSTKEVEEREGYEDWR